MSKLVFLLAAGIVFLLQYPVWGQDSVEVVIVSQRVGPFIEQEEWNYYNIYFTDKNFQMGYFVRDSDEVYSAIYIILDEEGLQERKFSMKKTGLLSLGTKINNYEKMKSGNYKAGENPAELAYKWFKKTELKNEVQMICKNSVNYPLLEYIGTDYSTLFKHYPRFGFGLGLAYLNFNFDELAELTQVVDKYYSDKGYYIYPVEPEYKTSYIFKFKGLVEFTSDLSASLTVEYGLTDKNIEYNAVTLMGTYSFNNLLEYFIPFAGLGYTRNNFSITINYGSVSVDTLGGKLESVSLDGGTEGLIAEAGIKRLLGNSFVIGIAADYYFLTSYKYKVNYIGFGSEIKPGNFGAGIFINILF